MKKYKLLIPALGLYSVFSHASSINIDGILDEQIWQEAQVIDTFVTTAPYSLAKPEYKTEVRMYTNEQGIYIGIKNFQPKETQLSNRSARDASINADFNSVIIDFDNSGVAAYRFSIGNGGSMLDGIYRNENVFSSEWDGVWFGKTSADERHWFSEILIPWDVAPMVSGFEGTRHLGLHVERRLTSQQKTYASQSIHESKQRFLSGLAAVPVKDYSGASVQTFVSLTARQDRVRDESEIDASLDLFWKPDSSKQLSLTINPDFGHVDSDNLVVNFSPTETFFSENRAFFTENQSLFTLNGPENLRLVHTRRIGAKPDVGDAVGADINGALKFTSVNDDVSYGVFAAMEDGDDVASGRDFYTGRVMHKTDEYNLGYLVTFTERPDINRDAFVQAIDYGYFINKDTRLNGQVIHSRLSQNDIDANDSATWFTFGHQFAENWEQSLTASYYGDEFEINDLGFLPRNDLFSLSYSNLYKNHAFAKARLFQEHQMELSLSHKENTDGLKLNSSITYRDGWSLKDSRYVQWQLTYEDKAHDDLITRGNNVLNTDRGYELDLFYRGDTSGKLRYHHHVTLYDRTVNGKGSMLHTHPSYYFSDNYVLTLGLWYTKAEDWLIWQGGNQINGYKRSEFTTNLNFNATIDDKQELNFRFQWVALSAKGRQTYDVDADGELVADRENPRDFSVSDTAVQVRYRYEIAPLSNIYVVYSRGGRATLDDDESLSDLFSPGWDKRDGDNLSFKIRYQF